MGVTGLLPLLKSIQRPTELKKCSGQTLAVDAYGWLHRAAYSCALELGQGKPTKKYINAAMNRVRMLRHFGVTPYMVFDGDYLPSKAATEDSRAAKRDEKKKLAMELLKAGKPGQATQEFQKCIDITPEMASALIHELKKMDIPYVVAPYEADAQLVYLERKGLVNGILSDDSDLLVFGAKRLLTKLDQYGNCIEINRRDFCACREISLTGWTDAEFRRMAILSGCDYLDGLPGVGLKTAYRLLRKTKSPERVVRMVQFEGKRVSENYLTLFYQAELTFLHQWVFCPLLQELVHLTELDGTRTAEEMPFIGAYVDKEMAAAISRGDINPITKAPIIIPTTPTKRRHSQSVTSAPIQHPIKPINSYFKGHQRIPMGAMDPNCFSVDPQRLAQVTDGGQAPRVFPLPRPYLEGDQAQPDGQQRPYVAQTRTSPRLLRRHTESISGMLSQMSSTPARHSRTSSGPAARPSPAPTPASEPPARPPKKARLCDDNAAEDISPKQSKFFTPGPTRKSPRRAKSEAYLLSDDSIDEALLSLPDIDGWNAVKKVEKTVAVFEDTSQETSQGMSETAQTTQETVTSKSGDNQPSAADGTPPSSIESAMPPPKTLAPPSRLVSTPATRASLSRFSYSNTSTATPASAATSRRSSIFSAVSTPSTAPSTAAASSSRLTALQRLGAKALNPASPRPMPRPPRRTAATDDSKGFLAGLPVNPAFVPLPPVDWQEVGALNGPTGCGSEDLIVPADEGDQGNEDAVDLPPRRLDLSRFAFS